MQNQINNTQHANNTKTIIGIFLVGIGLMALLKGTSLFYLPHIIFSWPLIMIGFGLYTGFKSNFKKTGWIFITAIGFMFLLPNIIPSLTFGLLWPIAIIAIGVSMYSRRNQTWNGRNWEKHNGTEFHKFDNNI